MAPRYSSLKSMEFTRPVERSNFKILIQPRNFGDFFHNEYSDGAAFDASKENNTICLKHKTCYAISILSFSDFDAIAEIKIDGTLIGNFHITARDITCIERPVHINRSFVLISKDSQIAISSNADISSPHSGIVKIVIHPANPKNVQQSLPAGCVSSSPKYGCALASGVSVVSDETDGCGFNKQTDSTTVGMTVLGDVTQSTYTVAPNFDTLGCHIFKILLKIGSPSTNTKFYLDGPTRRNYISTV